MTKLSRRSALRLAGSGMALSFVSSNHAFAAVGPYEFVRIEAIANQVVGEALLKEVYSRTDMSITVTPMPGKRALQQASSGAKDGETLRVFALGENVKSLVRVPTALYSLPTVAFAKKGTQIALKSPEDLKNYSCAIVAGVLHSKAITNGVPKLNEVDSTEAMFKLVSAGRTDLAISSSLQGRGTLNSMDIADIEEVKPWLNEQPLFHYVHESKKDIVPVVDAVIKDMVASGELGELQSKFENEYLDGMLGTK